MIRNLLNKINKLNFGLFFRQTWETGQNARKSAAREIFSAMLSTETVDRFCLAPMPHPVQRRARIAAYRSVRIGTGPTPGLRPWNKGEYL